MIPVFSILNSQLREEFALIATTLSIHEGRTDAAPDAVGLDAARLQLLDEHFRGLIEAGHIQGASYLVARDGQIVVHRSQGHLTYEENSSALLPNSIRKVYSITKVFTAIAIAQLAEAGKLFYQQSVSEWIPELNTDQHRGITIWHLLTHTSGLMGDPGVQTEPYTLPWYEWWLHEKKSSADDWTLEDGIKTIVGGRMYCKPGEQWNYCTAGFALLGLVIERASGMSYEQYVRERITEPLGMERTFLHVPEHLRAETCIVNPWQEKEVQNSFDRTGIPAAAGNGLFSTLEDLWRLGQAMLDDGQLHGQRILGRKTVRMMVSNQLNNIPSTCWGDKNPNFQMGLGWSLSHQDICSPGTYAHEGAGHCGLFVDPIERLVYAFMVPSQTGWVPQAIINPRAIIWSALL